MEMNVQLPTFVIFYTKRQFFRQEAGGTKTGTSGLGFSLQTVAEA
jgi:hypothetical protein